MALTSTTQNFWVQNGIFVVSVVALSVLIGLRWNWLAALIFLLFGAFSFVSFIQNLKAKLLKGMTEDWEVELVDSSSGIWVGKDWIDQQTQQLEALGFQKLHDYRVSGQLAFSRCMSHLHYCCFADVFTFCTQEGEILLENIVLGSLLTDGWSVSHINREPSARVDGMSCLRRHSKELSVGHDYPTVEALLNAHLEFRDYIQRDLRISVIPDVSWDAYVQHQRDAMITRKQVFRQTHLLVGMFKVAQFELNPQSEWLGDYGKKLRIQGKLRTS